MRQALLFAADAWPPNDEATNATLTSLLEAGYALSVLACGPPCLPALSLPAERGAGLRCTYVAVLSKCPNWMPPRDLRTKGALCYPLRREHLQRPAWRGDHRDWTKDGRATVHATSTGASYVVACAPRAAHILDGEEETFWRSDDVDGGGGWRPAAGGAADGEAGASASATGVSITIDLGAERSVDRVAIFWGGSAIEEAPARAELLIAPDDGTVEFRPGAAGASDRADGAVSAVGGAAVSAPRVETGMRGGRSVFNEEFMGAEANYKRQIGADDTAGLAATRAALAASAGVGSTTSAQKDREEKRKNAALKLCGGYLLGTSCSICAFDPSPRRVRYVQLRLLEPAARSTTFAIRNVMVIGPDHSAGERGASTGGGAWADVAASESIRRFFLAKDEVALAPDAAEEAAAAERARAEKEKAQSLIVWAIENQMKLNKKAATEIPTPPRFDPPLRPAKTQTPPPHGSSDGV